MNIWEFLTPSVIIQNYKIRATPFTSSSFPWLFLWWLYNGSPLRQTQSWECRYHACFYLGRKSWPRSVVYHSPSPPSPSNCSYTLHGQFANGRYILLGVNFSLTQITIYFDRVLWGHFPLLIYRFPVRLFPAINLLLLRGEDATEIEKVDCFEAGTLSLPLCLSLSLPPSLSLSLSLVS